MFAEAPRFLQFPTDVEGLWRKTVLDAFRFVDGELVTKVKSCMPVGSPAVVALFMQEYLVLVNRGATCKSDGPILHGTQVTQTGGAVAVASRGPAESGGSDE
jgi:hypothetical protein